MNKFTALLAIGTLAAAGPAIGHPPDQSFESFGECQAELNKQNKVDRERVGSFFPSNGAAQVNMLNNWECEYDPDTDAWYFSGQPMGGDNLGNGNGKADPGANGQ